MGYVRPLLRDFLSEEWSVCDCDCDCEVEDDPQQVVLPINTSLRRKVEEWPTFVEACRSQWECGGTRYALSEDKEFTDLVCEAAGNQWIGGTIIKYVGEIINARRAGEAAPEVDFFKVAVYAFLWWLKERGNVTSRDKGEEFSAA